MPDRPSPISLDLSGLREVPPAEIAPLVETVARDPEERALSTLTALLMNRVLRLLRQGSRQELLDESLMLNRVLAIEAGTLLCQSRPEAFGRWSALGELLSGAARATGRAAVPAILSGTRGREILELLAGEGRPVARSDIKRRLRFTSESHLSHLLRDLEEADLVLRYKPEGGKEVVVSLGDVGQQVVEQSVLPPWLEQFEAALQAGPPLEAEALAARLAEAGAPSRLAAERLVRAVASFASVQTVPVQIQAPQRAKIFNFKTRETRRPEEVIRLEEVENLQDGARPASLFVAEEEPAAA